MSRRCYLSAAFFSTLFCLSATSIAADTSPVSVLPQDPAVHYVGRWDTRDAAGPKADWSASEIDLRFQGTGLNVKLKLMGPKDADRFQIVLDGTPTEVIKLTKTETLYTVAKDIANKEHTVQIVKRTEAAEGATQFQGFEIAAGGKALPWVAKPSHRLEMIGDSITCGYGNEDTDRNHHFTNATENAYETYGPIAARKFNAECTIVAWSGRKMFPSNTMPAVYGQTLGGDGKSKWDFTKWQPDAVVINLSTNDMKGDDVPDPDKWVAAYEKFVSETVRKNYPNADIFISMSPMSWGKKTSNLKQHLEAVKTDLADKGDKKIHVLDITPQDQKDGYGADWHPNVATQKKMAAVLSKALEDLGWKAEQNAEEAAK